MSDARHREQENRDDEVPFDRRGAALASVAASLAAAGALLVLTGAATTEPPAPDAETALTLPAAAQSADQIAPLPTTGPASGATNSSGTTGSAGASATSASGAPGASGAPAGTVGASGPTLPAVAPSLTPEFTPGGTFSVPPAVTSPATSPAPGTSGTSHTPAAGTSVAPGTPHTPGTSPTPGGRPPLIPFTPSLLGSPLSLLSPLVSGNLYAPAPARSTAPPAPTALPRSKPTRLTIPAIGVDTRVMPLGLQDDGTVEVPPLRADAPAGWYRYLASPGEVGPAVLLGHVDTARDGAAVFYRLGQLQRGDRVEITRADGRTAVFSVTAVEKYRKDAFPTRAVYGQLDHPGLRLVTCGGRFDHASGSYLDNVVVYGDYVAAK